MSRTVREVVGGDDLALEERARRGCTLAME
jgi:hypothetical protein